MGVRHPTYVVGIGGSAGALNAYTGLLDGLPPQTGMAFVFVYHVHPDANTQLALILSRHTTMPVRLASNAMLIQANHVYVIPQGTDLLMEGDAFKVVSPRTGRNKQVDLFLMSLAEAKGTRAIGIILSGYDGDGTAGCTHVKAKGGTTFAQDRSAEVNGMPLSAQASRCVDSCCRPTKLPRGLPKLVRASRKIDEWIRRYSPNLKLTLPSVGARAQSAPAPERSPQVKARNLYTRFLWHFQAYLA
jgi:chemotaxis response regulator CheB